MIKAIKRILATLAVVACALIIASCENDDNTPELAGTSQITGNVDSFEISVPVMAGMSPGVLVTISGPVTRSANTDASGNFVFSDLPAGSYSFTFTYDGEELSYRGNSGQTAFLAVGEGETLQLTDVKIAGGHVNIGNIKTTKPGDKEDKEKEEDTDSDEEETGEDQEEGEEDTDDDEEEEEEEDPLFMRIEAESDSIANPENIAHLIPSGYIIADWNDLLYHTDNDGDIEEVWAEIAGPSIGLTRNGEVSNGTRYYFAQYSERPGQTPQDGFASHDNIGQLHLGSWTPRHYIMLVKESFRDLQE